MKQITRWYSEVSITSSGSEINILGNVYPNISGLIKNIAITQNSGSATEISVCQIRYESGNSDISNLIYSAVDMTLSSNDVSDSFIDAPFSLYKPASYTDIILYIQPDATGIFTIRLDIEID